MAITVQLLTTLNSLQELHKLAEAQAKTVKINPEVLKLLLIDHSVMFRAISDTSYFKVKEPRNREKL